MSLTKVKDTNLDLTANTATVLVGNSTVNVSINTSSISINGNTVPTLIQTITFNLAL